MAAVSDDPAALVARHIELNPHKPGAAEARLRESSVSVWAIVDYWYGVNFDKAQTAQAYEVPAEAVEAALAYYKAHKALIDARLALMAV